MNRLVKGTHNEKIELKKNISGEFESRFSTIKTKRSKSILQNIEKNFFGEGINSDSYNE